MDQISVNGTALLDIFEQVQREVGDYATNKVKQYRFRAYTKCAAVFDPEAFQRKERVRLPPNIMEAIRSRWPDM